MNATENVETEEMKHKFSLAHLTLIGCTPPELAYIAARAGYDFVSLRLIPMGVPGEAPGNPMAPHMIRATRQALDSTGIEMHDLELARILPHVAPAAYEPAMEVAAELGARHVICSAWTTKAGDRSFLVERYAEICDLAAPYGLTVDLEFPYISRLKTLEETADVVRAGDRPNGGILIDTLYVHLSGLDPRALARLPREWFHFVHIADAPKAIPATRDDTVRLMRDARLYPGEGCIDFRAIAAALPPVTYSIELPNLKRVAELGYEGHARRCLETAARSLEPPFRTDAPLHKHAA
jgi:sugar phosphate isomerase/epimerase